MKIIFALAIISTVQSAAIKTNVSTLDDSTSENIPENLENEIKLEIVAQSEDSITEEIPDWLIEFKQYIDGDDEIEFDLGNFLKNLEQNEVGDFFDLLVMLIDEELSVTETNYLFSDNWIKIFFQPNDCYFYIWPIIYESSIKQPTPTNYK